MLCLLIVKRAGTGEVLDLAEHLDPNTPLFGKVIFRSSSHIRSQGPLSRRTHRVRSLKNVLVVSRNLPAASSMIGSNSYFVRLFLTP